MKMRFPLAHGTLLIMHGETLRYWEHSIPKRRGGVGVAIQPDFSANLW